MNMIEIYEIKDIQNIIYEYQLEMEEFELMEDIDIRHIALLCDTSDYIVEHLFELVEHFDNESEVYIDIELINDEIMSYLRIIINKVVELQKYKLLKDFKFYDNVSFGIHHDNTDYWLIFEIDNINFINKRHEHIFMKHLQNNIYDKDNISADRCHTLQVCKGDEEDLFFFIGFTIKDDDSD